MTATKITSQMTISGPIFQKNADQTFLQNVRRMLDEMSQEAAEDIKQQMAVGASSRAELSIGGRVADRVVGRVTRLEGGVQWRYHMVASPSRNGLDKNEAIALYAGSAEVERQVHAFRHTRSAIRVLKPVIRANLMEGLE